MSTHSRIGKLNPDGTVTSIYCHWDGGFWHVGPTLLTHYDNPDRVTDLLLLGDLSQLGATPTPTKGKPHTFDNPQDGVCIAYGRDRGELRVDAVTTSRDDFSTRCAEEYNYLYDNGWWARRADWQVWKPLKQAVEEYEEARR